MDLLRLYHRVVNDGGYDAVSDTKRQKLAWRAISQEFHLGTANLALMAFNLKTVYYRNLALVAICGYPERILKLAFQGLRDCRRSQENPATERDP